MAPVTLLPNKVCVVTGGSRGIGAAIAERFAAEGATLVLAARSERQLQKVNVLYDIGLSQQHCHRLNASSPVVRQFDANSHC